MVHFLTWYPAKIIRGPFSDRPTANVMHDTMFIDEDTHKFYFWDEMMAEWMEHSAVATNTSIVASMSVYRVGDMVTVRNNLTGLKVFEEDDTGTGDASLAFQYAIDNMPDETSSQTNDIKWAGAIAVMSGLYQCKTPIVMNGVTLGYHGVSLIGENRASTKLRFAPTTPIASGFDIRMARPSLRNLRIYGNNNVPLLVSVVGPGHSAWYGSIDNCQFDGANYDTANGYENGLAAWKGGQTGVKFDGTNISLYFWNINQCFFHGFEIALHFYERQITSCETSNCAFDHNRICIKTSGGQHNFNNIWLSGDANYGDIGIWVLPEGANGVGAQNNFSNISIELLRTASILTNAIAGSATLDLPNLPRQGAIGILLDAGTGNNKVASSVIASSAPGGKVVDKATPYSNFVDEDAIPNRVSKNLTSLLGSWLAGVQRPGLETGLLQGNIVEDPAGTFTNLATANGACRSITSSATNQVRSIYFSNTGATGGSSVFNRQTNPQLSVRFYTVNNTDVRLFIGLWDKFTAPGAGPLADPLGNRSGVGLWMTTAAGNTDYKVMHNNGATNSTISTFASPIPQITNGRVLQTIISTDDAAGTFVVSVDGLKVAGSPAIWSMMSKAVTTAIPATGGALGWLISFESLSGSKSLRLFEIELETRGIK